MYVHCCITYCLLRCVMVHNPQVVLQIKASVVREQHIMCYPPTLPLPFVKEQLKQLKEGFNMLVPSHLLASFSAKELEWIISGEHGLNISVLQRRTKYMAGYSKASEVIQWLWKILQTYSEVRCLTLCSVCTHAVQLLQTAKRRPSSVA